MDYAEPKYWIVDFAGKYTAEILWSTILPPDHPKNENKEEEIVMLLRPHSNMEHYEGDTIRKIPDDPEKRQGDFPIKHYPTRLIRFTNTDPSYTRIWLYCDFDGNEIHKLGLEGEQYAVKLKDSQMEILAQKKLIAQKNAFIYKMSESKNFQDEILRKIDMAIDRGMGKYLSQEKSGKKD